MFSSVGLSNKFSAGKLLVAMQKPAFKKQRY